MWLTVEPFEDDSPLIIDPDGWRQTRWVPFAQTRRELLPLLLWRLAKAHTGSATVLVDEIGVDSLGHAADGLRR